MGKRRAGQKTVSAYNIGEFTFREEKTLKLTSYLPEVVALSIRDYAIKIHDLTKTITREEFQRGVNQIGLYEWEILEFGEYRASQVFLTGDRDTEEAIYSSPFTVTIFPNILVPLTKTDLECEINIYATEGSTTASAYKAQYLVQIYKEKKWRDEVIDIYSTLGSRSLISPTFHLDFLLGQLADCLVTGKRN